MNVLMYEVFIILPVLFRYFKIHFLDIFTGSHKYKVMEQLVHIPQKSCQTIGFR